MRRLLANASTADECRLLVDMFLAQAGMPLREADFQPDPVSELNKRQEENVVDALLSGGGADAANDKQSARSSGESRNGMPVPPTPSSDDYRPSAVYNKTPPAQVVSAEA